MAGNRPPSSHHSAFPGRQGARNTHTTLIIWDALWPSRTTPRAWQQQHYDMTAWSPHQVNQECWQSHPRVNSRDFLLQPSRFRAASLIASSALPEAAALATRSSNSVLAKTTLFGTWCHLTYLLSQWNQSSSVKAMNWKLDASLISFSLYIVKFAFYPLKRCPALWGWGLYNVLMVLTFHCGSGELKYSNFSCMCGCAQLTDF